MRYEVQRASGTPKEVADRAGLKMALVGHFHHDSNDYLAYGLRLYLGCGGSECGHKIRWFSPNTLFEGQLAVRLKVAFKHVLSRWLAVSRCLNIARVGKKGASVALRETAPAEVHVISQRSALNWCSAATTVQSDRRNERCSIVTEREDVELTKCFATHLEKYPWIWANNCWHPHRTPLSQKGIGFVAEDRDVFQAKLRIMCASVKCDLGRI